MSVTEGNGPVDRSTSLIERIEAVGEFAEVTGRLLVVGDMKWADMEADFRLLAINNALRRQQETMQAAVLLARQDLGHLAVAFVRASLEDVMYLEFFLSLDLDDSQKLFTLLGIWDSLRSLIAQRNYIGDEEMAQLWYPKAFLDSKIADKEKIKTELKALQKQYKWSGGMLPSGDWIADRAGKQGLYDYLHAATSRALHFSAGEILRRGWGQPSGKLSTDKTEFREHLTHFALDQLWRLHLETWQASEPLLEASGISSDEELTFDVIKPALDRLGAAGKVPLVHAREWNLTPDGPLDLEGRG
jgi:hypothetical protein